MKKNKLFAILSVIVLGFSLSGCNIEMEASQVLPKMNEYFPGTVLYKFDKRVLWIQTEVDGISGGTAMSIYTDTCQKAAFSLGKIKLDITRELMIDGRTILVIGFRRGIVACDLRDGVDVAGVPRGSVMDWPHAKVWITQHIGYMPKPEQVLVFTLADLQKPKGQPLQLKTLAQIKQETRARLEAQVKDMLLHDSVEQEQNSY
jgi:hypothetical protein